MVEHFLPGGVELAAVLLQEPLLGQGDSLLGRTEDLHRPLKLLSGLLGFNLSLQIQKEQKKSYRFIAEKTTWMQLKKTSRSRMGASDYHRFSIVALGQLMFIHPSEPFLSSAKWSTREAFAKLVRHFLHFGAMSYFPEGATADDSRQPWSDEDTRTEALKEHRETTVAWCNRQKALSLKESDTSSVGSLCPLPDWKGRLFPTSCTFLDPLLAGVTERSVNWLNS